MFFQHWNKICSLSKKGAESLKGRSLFNKSQQQFNISNKFNNSFNRIPLYGWILGGNTLVYGLYYSNQINVSTFFKNFTLSWNGINQGYYHTLLSYSFGHANLTHFLANMLGLYFFGSSIESIFGPYVLAKLFVGGALLGAAFILAQENQKRSRNVSLGASSSLYAIMTYYALNFPQQKFLLFFVLPIPAWLFISGILLYTSYSFRTMDGVSHAGHLGGLSFGAIAYFLATRGRF